MKYYVIEAANIGTIGNPKFTTNVMLITESKTEASKYEEALRKTYKDRSIIDCYVRSEEDLEREKKVKERFEALTEEEKNDIIEVDGRKYIKAIYEANNK